MAFHDLTLHCDHFITAVPTPILPLAYITRHSGDLHAAHCLAATLLTSKTDSHWCLLGKGGPEQPAAAALPWLTMTAGAQAPPYSS